MFPTFRDVTFSGLVTARCRNVATPLCRLRRHNSEGPFTRTRIIICANCSRVHSSEYTRIHIHPDARLNLACECVVRLTRLVCPSAYAELQATMGSKFYRGSSLPKRGSWKNTVLVCSQHPLKPSILNTIQFRSKRLDRINLHRGKSNTRN